MKETFKAIPGYPDYQVSDLGRVRSFRQNKSGKILSQHADTNGYLTVKITNGNYKTINVHVLTFSTSTGKFNSQKEKTMNRIKAIIKFFFAIALGLTAVYCYLFVLPMEGTGWRNLTIAYVWFHCVVSVFCLIGAMVGTGNDKFNKECAELNALHIYTFGLLAVLQSLALIYSGCILAGIIIGLCMVCSFILIKAGKDAYNEPAIFKMR